MKFLLPLVFALPLATTAQESIHFESKDGTSADVDIISTSPDEGRNNSIYFGLFAGPEGFHNFGFSTCKPSTYYLNFMGGISGGIFDGSYFFTTKTKESHITQTIKGGGSIRYVGKLPLEKRTSFGVHGGVGYTDFSFFDSYNAGELKTMSAFAGLSLLKAKHIELVIQDERKGGRNGTLLFRVNADAIIYFGQRVVESKVAGIPTTPVNDIARKIGFRLYADGKATLWGRKGRLSLNYILGAGLLAQKVEQISLIGGAGLGYNF